MSNLFICKAKRIDNNEWIVGRVWRVNENDKHFIFPLGCNIYDSNGISGLSKKFDGHFYILEAVEIKPNTICFSTGKCDKENNDLYSDDIIKMNDGSIALIEHGEFEMYCPIDDMYLDNVGFYVSSPQFEIAMPLGPTENYALKLGNYHDNPEILEVATNES